MPPTDLVYFRDEDGAVPLLDWLALGYELRRPEADMLRDGVHELGQMGSFWVMTDSNRS